MVQILNDLTSVTKYHFFVFYQVIAQQNPADNSLFLNQQILSAIGIATTLIIIPDFPCTPLTIKVYRSRVDTGIQLQL